MSDQGHAAHDHSQEHSGHEHEHDQGHGHGDEHWGDYNAEPPPPSNLPPIGGGALAVFGLALAAMLASTMLYSFRLVTAAPQEEHSETTHAEHP